MARYSILKPFNVDEKLNVCVYALKFFSALSNKEMCRELGIETEENKTYPLSDFDLLRYLIKTNLLPDPWRYYNSILSLLKKMEQVGILEFAGKRNNANCYYFVKELTQKQRNSLIWLTPAIGADFLRYLLSPCIVQITGKINEDIHAGSGIFISPTIILTCAHVLDDMQIDEVQLINGQEIRVVDFKSHPKIDVGFIKIEHPFDYAENQVVFAQPNILDEIYVMGFPKIPFTREATLIVQKGEVNSTNTTALDGSNVFFFSAVSRPGNSGGPIISSDGYIVGIVSKDFSSVNETSLPFYAGVPTSEIIKALNEIDENITLPLENYE